MREQITALSDQRRGDEARLRNLTERVEQLSTKVDDLKVVAQVPPILLQASSDLKPNAMLLGQIPALSERWNGNELELGRLRKKLEQLTLTVDLLKETSLVYAASSQASTERGLRMLVSQPLDFNFVETEVASGYLDPIPVRIAKTVDDNVWCISKDGFTVGKHGFVVGLSTVAERHGHVADVTTEKSEADRRVVCLRSR